MRFFREEKLPLSYSFLIEASADTIVEGRPVCYAAYILRFTHHLWVPRLSHKIQIFMEENGREQRQGLGLGVKSGKGSYALLHAPTFVLL